MSEELYERTEADIVNGTEFPLFRVGGKAVKVLPLSIRRADDWLGNADEAAGLALPVDAIGHRLNELQAEYASLLEAHAKQSANASPPQKPVTDDDIAQAKERVAKVRRAWRERLREYLNAVCYCIADYDEKLNIDELVERGLTDGQIISAFSRLRYFNDPLAQQQVCTAAVLKAQRNALK